MKTFRHLNGRALIVSMLASLSLCPRLAAAFDVVRNGDPVATIVVQRPATSSPAKSRRGRPSADERAANVLAEWVLKMTDAELPVSDQPIAGSPSIYVGAAAIQAGLKLDDIESPSREGLRVRCDGRRLLLAGQDDTSTVKAACRLLEQWGCRYYMDHPLGEVFPRQKSLSIGKLDIQEKPQLVYRRIWGSQWSGDTLWKIWNGHGGLSLSTGHSWGGYLSKDLFDSHPEYFRMREGRREPSDWYCTSNSHLRKEFADSVIERIGEGNQHPSLSPPDGRGYCQCADCQAQDDPHSVEPSSGHVCITNRYLDFYQAVARQVKKPHPDSILSFYCYADYTQAPTSGIQLEPNLCAWIAPIRYCRFHAIGDSQCPSRRQLQQLIEDWARTAQKMAYRTYNYNLAECCVPFSKISVWTHDIPYLADKGCIGINLETLANWQIYGPHIYLSIRLAYDPQADATAIMDEYFLGFYGPQAGPIMKRYWMDIDRAFAELPTHAGSFFSIHRVYTPEFLKHLEQLTAEAKAAAKPDEVLSNRVAMADEGLRNAKQYIGLRNAMNRGDLQRARRVYDQLMARSEANRKQGQGNHYTIAYLKRFVGTHVLAAAEATSESRRLRQVLPDTWKMKYDDGDSGIGDGFFAEDFDDTDWSPVATFSDTLDAQGLPDRHTILWYRTKFNADNPVRRPALFFTEIDGDTSVWVNGREVGASEKKRKPFQVDVSQALVQGENTITVRVDHTGMTELFLGGIVRPVYLIDTRPQEQGTKRR